MQPWFIPMFYVTAAVLGGLALSRFERAYLGLRLRRVRALGAGLPFGCGVGGLAAKAIAPYFARVTVMDRDALPDRPVARMGTP